MAQIQIFTFNAFAENTYIIHDKNGECIIIDPGCSTRAEEKELRDFVSDNDLKPVLLVNTHCHIDHVLGNAFVSETYGLGLGIHAGDKVLLDAVKGRASVWGVDYTESPSPSYFLEPGKNLGFASVSLEIRFVPGHAPGHVVFVNHQERYLLAGDTLFQGSIGRTDLPFGDFDMLEASIRKEIYTLPDDYVVYPGHGPSTTVGNEKAGNPYVRP